MELGAGDHGACRQGDAACSMRPLATCFFCLRRCRRCRALAQAIAERVPSPTTTTTGTPGRLFVCVYVCSTGSCITHPAFWTPARPLPPLSRRPTLPHRVHAVMLTRISDTNSLPSPRRPSAARAAPTWLLLPAGYTVSIGPSHAPVAASQAPTSAAPGRPTLQLSRLRRRSSPAPAPLRDFVPGAVVVALPRSPLGLARAHWTVCGRVGPAQSRGSRGSAPVLAAPAPAPAPSPAPAADATCGTGRKPLAAASAMAP